MTKENKFKGRIRTNSITSTDEITEDLYKQADEEKKPEPVKEEPKAVSKVDPDPVPVKKVGRPAKEKKKCISVYVPEKDVRNVELAAKLFEFKSAGDYIASLVQKDLSANGDKIVKFEESINALKSL